MSCGSCWRTSPSCAAPAACPRSCARSATPAPLADAVTAWSEVVHRAPARPSSRRSRSACRVELVLAWAKEHLAELQVDRADPRRTSPRASRSSSASSCCASSSPAIRKELGEGDDDAVDDYRARLAELTLPDEGARGRRQGDRPAGAHQRPEPRAGLDPHVARPRARPAVGHARPTTTSTSTRPAQVLDADHDGPRRRQGPHRRVPGRAQAARRAGRRRRRRRRRATPTSAGQAAVAARRGDGAIVALVGPPGVGKTSLGECVARAMGRKLRPGRPRRRPRRGRDPRPPPHLRRRPARSHRAGHHRGRHHEPGRPARRGRQAVGRRLVAATRPRRCSRCSTRPRTTPSATTTSRSSSTCRDVVFIATANVIDTIPGPLLDRMELVRLDGYTEDEKVFIARNHLLPRQLRAGRAAARRGGARPTTRCGRSSPTTPARPACAASSVSSASWLRKVATKVAVGERPPTVPGRDVDADDVRTAYLGRAEVPRRGRRAHRRRPAWPPAWPSPAPAATSCSSRRPPPTGEPALTLTGQLGDVMKESAQIALSYVRSHAAALGVDPGAARTAASTSTSRPGRCPRTARRPASR